MSKYVILGDTHLGLYKSSDDWHDIVINLFKEIRDTCIRENISEIIHLGDFFHERKSINTKTLDIAQQIEDILLDTKMYIIVGNHDIFYRDKINPTTLQTFKHSNNITIIDEVTKIKNMIFVPWGQQPVGIDGRDKYCFGHFAINGFYMNNTKKCDRGINKEEVLDVCSFKHIYSGHFHTPSNKGNITYIGSPYPQTFNDINSKRGYYIFDSSNGDMKFIEYTSAPKFIKLLSEDEISSEKIKGNIVKLLFTKDYGIVENEKLIETVHMHKPFILTTDFSNISSESLDGQEESISLLSNVELLMEYADKFERPKSVKKKTLNEILENIIKEIEEE